MPQSCPTFYCCVPATVLRRFPARLEKSLRFASIQLFAREMVNSRAKSAILPWRFPSNMRRPFAPVQSPCAAPASYTFNTSYTAAGPQSYAPTGFSGRQWPVQPSMQLSHAAAAKFPPPPPPRWAVSKQRDELLYRGNTPVLTSNRARVHSWENRQQQSRQQTKHHVLQQPKQQQTKQRRRSATYRRRRAVYQQSKQRRFAAQQQRVLFEVPDSPVCPAAPLNSNEYLMGRFEQQHAAQQAEQAAALQLAEAAAAGLAEVAEWDPATQQASYLQVSTAPCDSAGDSCLESPVCPPAPRIDNEFYMARFEQQLKEESALAKAAVVEAEVAEWDVLLQEVTVLQQSTAAAMPAMCAFADDTCSQC